MRLPRQIALILEQHQLFARFWRSASLFWSVKKTSVVGLVVFMVAVVLLQLLIQVLLNLWNRHFFDALERKDAVGLWTQAQLFVPLAAASIVFAAASVWGRMTTQRSWREALTRHVLEKWLENDRFRRLNHHMVKGSENPEYRIVVDIRVATDAPVDLTLAFFSSILTSLTFFGVLWSIGGSITIAPFGWTVTIPGYLVFGVIIYSGAVSGLVMIFGHRLTSVIERMNQSEAEFRAAADAFGGGDHAEHKTSDADKRATAEAKLRSVLHRWREFLWQLVRTTFVSQGNTLFAPVVAWFLCVPKYLTGAMSLGELTQAAAAFVVVQTAFNWVVDNYQRLADWRASVHRVATLLLALDDCEAAEHKPPKS
jgi:vitamin B12/bleomycin/antimicrobial peptide transport system ATP-binding/permease protein